MVTVIVVSLVYLAILFINNLFDKSTTDADNRSKMKYVIKIAQLIISAQISAQQSICCKTKRVIEKHTCAGNNVDITKTDDEIIIKKKHEYIYTYNVQDYR